MSELGSRHSTPLARGLAIVLTALFVMTVLPLVLELGPGPAGAVGAEIVVDPNGNGDHTTIQAAINAANPGDTVRVWNGTYYETVTISTMIDLIGNGSESTRMIGETWRTIDINTNGARVSRFNLTSSHWSPIVVDPGSYDNIRIDNCSVAGRSCISFSGSSQCSVENCTIDGDIDGSGIGLNYATECYFKDNSLITCGFGITGANADDVGSHSIDATNLVNGKPVMHLNNMVAGTYTGEAGQVLLMNCSGVTIEGVNVTGANPGFYALYCNDININNCSAITCGEGLIVNYCQFVNVTNFNSSDNDKKGLYVINSDDIKFVNVSLIDNDEEAVYNDLADGTSFFGGLISGNNLRGMNIRFSDGLNIDSMTFIDNGVDVSIFYADDTLVNDSKFLGPSSNGIHQSYSEDNTFTNNTFDGPACAIACVESERMELGFNDMSGCGVTLSGDSDSHWDSHWINGSNKVNGLPIYYRKNTHSVVIGGGIGQVILSNCNFYTVTNTDVSNSTRGLQVYSCSSFQATNVTSNDNQRGIMFHATMQGTISNCEFARCDIGIELYYLSQFNDIIGTSFIDCGDGVNDGSDYTEVRQCTFIRNARAVNIWSWAQDLEVDRCTFRNNDNGLWATYTSTIHLHNSTFNGGTNGLYIYETTDSTFEYNSFTNLTAGCYIYDGLLINLNNNDFTNCGISLAQPLMDWTDTCFWDYLHMGPTNMVNGRPLLFIKYNAFPVAEGVDWGQVIIYRTDWVNITNASLSRSTIGAQVGFSSNIRFVNCDMDDNFAGAYLWDDDKLTLINCSAMNASSTPLFLTNHNQEGEDHLFEDCRFQGGTVTPQVREADSITFNRCEFTGSVNGLRMTQMYHADINYCKFNGNDFHGLDMVDCEYAILFESDFNDNAMYGLMMRNEASWLSSSWNDVWRCRAENNGVDGIHLRETHDCSIQFTKIHGNLGSGINVLDVSQSIDITENEISSNTQYAVSLGPFVSDCSIHHNNIFSNGAAFSQGYDLNGSNDWDDWTEGNFWDNWTSPDADGDGIVDKPYSISGSGGQDHFPLTGPYGYPYLHNKNIQVQEDTYLDTDLMVIDENMLNSDYEVTVIPQLPWLDISIVEWSSTELRIKFSGIPTNDDVGTDILEVTYYDGLYNVSSTVVIEVFNTNDDPEIFGNHTILAYEDHVFEENYTATDIDPGVDVFTWGVESNTFQGQLEIYDGRLIGIPIQEDVGSHSIDIICWDHMGGRSELAVLIHVTEVNDPPEINSPTMLYCNEDEMCTLPIDVFDEEDTIFGMTFSVQVKPDFLTFGFVNFTAKLSGTPENEDVGTHLINVRVQDSEGSYAWYNATLRVNNTNDAPIITTGNVWSVNEDELYYVDYDAEDIDPTNDTLIWNLSADCDFLTIGILDGILRGTPDSSDIGHWNVSISVHDGNGGWDHKSFVLQVLNVNEPPMITNTTLNITEDGGRFYLNLTNYIIDPDGEELNLVITQQSNLSAAILDNLTLWIEPAQDFNGLTLIRIRVNDKYEQRYMDIWVNVTPTNDVPTIWWVWGSGYWEITEGDFYAGTVDYSDIDLDMEGDEHTVTWTSDIDGNIGSGNSINITTLSPGQHTITVTVTDSAGSSDTASMTILVHEKAEEPESFNFAPVCVGLAIVLIIFAAIAFHLVMTRIQNPEPPPGEPPTETPPDMPDGIAEDDFIVDQADAREWTTTYYDFLGLTQFASDKDIKKAYRSMAKQLHPDVNEEDAEKMIILNKAKDCLLDPERRAGYDAYVFDGIVMAPPPENKDDEEWFEDDDAFEGVGAQEEEPEHVDDDLFELDDDDHDLFESGDSSDLSGSDLQDDEGLEFDEEEL